MNITPTALDALFYNFDLRYQAAFMAAQALWPQLATEIPSTGDNNRYPFIDRLPRMREWLGERQIQNIAARNYTLKNRDWELTTELERNTVQDDQYGIYASMVVPMMGMQAKTWPDDLLVDVLQNGHTSGANYLGHDGQPFFNTSHPINPDNAASAVQSNYSSTGLGLTPQNFNTARATMMAYQGADGKPLGITPNLLIVPPALEVAARQILQSTFIAPTAQVGIGAANTVQSNVLLGMAQLVVMPRLAGQDTTWYLADTSKVVMPFIFQLRKPPDFIFRNRPDDSNVFLRKKFLFGVDSRGAMGFGLYFLCYKAVA